MNIFGYILVIITILITVLIGVKQPPMHNRVIIYDSQYTIKEEPKSKSSEVVINERDIPTAPIENVLTQEQRVFEEPVQSVSVKETVQVKQQPKVATKTKEIQTIQKNNLKSKTTETKNIQQKVVTSTQKQTVTAPVTSQQTVTQKPSVQTTQTVKVLTEQEELIAWNKWHSNLQNQILKDIKLPVIPMGTVFRVSFDVDKYGRVSNVQTWSENSQYTPYAIEYVAPVIRSYQGKSILDFPEGSNRTKTTFNGRWKISQNAKYSTPDNYHDIEKVIK